MIGHEWQKKQNCCACRYKNDPNSPLHWEEQWANHLRSVKEEKHMTRDMFREILTTEGIKFSGHVTHGSIESQLDLIEETWPNIF